MTKRPIKMAIREKVHVLKETLDMILKDHKNKKLTDLEVLTDMNYACDDFETDLLHIAINYNIAFDIKHTIR